MGPCLPSRCSGLLWHSWPRLEPLFPSNLWPSPAISSPLAISAHLQQQCRRFRKSGLEVPVLRNGDRKGNDSTFLRHFASPPFYPVEFEFLCFTVSSTSSGLQIQEKASAQLPSSHSTSSPTQHPASSRLQSAPFVPSFPFLPSGVPCPGHPLLQNGGSPWSRNHLAAR